MRVWDHVESRPTRDIDLLGPVGLSAGDVESLVRESFQVEVEPDGIELDEESIRVTPIRIEQQHIGFRAKFSGFSARTRLRFQVDIGVGDSVIPEPVKIELPALLAFPAPRLKAYTPYTTIAEKFEAIVKLELANTRLKDYFDLAALAARLELDGDTLTSALISTFGRRGIELPEDPPPGLTESFVDAPAKVVQWNAFVRKSHLEDRALSLADTVERIRDFLMPAVTAAARKRAFRMKWPPGGPWQARG